MTHIGSTGGQSSVYPRALPVLTVLLLCLLATFQFGIPDFSTGLPNLKATAKDEKLDIPDSTSACLNSSKTKWGVITTILEVNPAVEHFVTHYNDACLVVVGDHKTNHTLWRDFETKHLLSLIYLSPQDQHGKKALIGYSIVQLLPWNHFGRKNIGFMFAIAHGADLIYDFDDDNHLTAKSFEEAFSGMSVRSVRMPSNHHVWNPYQYFEPTLKDAAPASVWPLGFPLQFVNDPNTSQIKLGGTKKTVPDLAVVQSLADHDPDVDGIYRMTQQLPVRFAKRDAVLIPPRGTFVPWSAQATLIRRAAFFGLLLPVTVEGRVTDIWRSYITLRLLWETAEEIGFTSPIVSQFRNPHSYMKDFLDEDDLYKKADLLLETLAAWSSDRFETLDEAYVNIVSVLVDQHILERHDLDLARAWVADLERAG